MDPGLIQPFAALFPYGVGVCEFEKLAHPILVGGRLFCKVDISTFGAIAGMPNSEKRPFAGLGYLRVKCLLSFFIFSPVPLCNTRTADPYLTYLVSAALS